MKRLCMGCMQEYDDKYEICPHCGYMADMQANQAYYLTPGYVLYKRYIVGKVLGAGGFGVTYIGWDYLIKRKVAIKEYLPSELATRMPGQEALTVYGGDQEIQFRDGVKKTIDEARHLAQFTSVQGIVHVYDCFEWNKTAYIVMEYLDGMSLKEYLKEKGPMTEEQAIPVILQLATAMDVVHKSGLLHRDIAPDNIYVLNPDEPDALRVKLLDFGAAHFASNAYSKSISVMLKQGYAPEEQYRSRGDQGTWTDVYALAATLYKMLTGVTPEDALERKVKDEVKKPSKQGVKISKPVETALMNAMNIRVQDRTLTMESFTSELIAADVEARAVTEERNPGLAVPRWFWAAAGAGAGLLMLVAVLLATGVIRLHVNTEKTSLEENMVRVPNVINQYAEDAETLLLEKELRMSRDKMVYSSEVPLNMISYQELRENTAVEKNTTLVVWISKGEEKGVVPAVKGLQQAEAEQLLRERGFQNIAIEESMDEGLYLSVLDMDAEPGENLPLSQEIVLTVCMNEEEQRGDSTRLVSMPDVQGLTRDAAREKLEEQGLLINWVEVTDDLPVGTVLGQEPKARTSVNAGSYVTVRVSKGADRIYMKNVQLMTEAEAIREIEALGLAAGSISREYSDTINEGKVISQSIQADEEVKRGDTVNLVVSRGRKPGSSEPRQDSSSRQAEEAARQEAEAQRFAEEQRAAEEAARQAAEAEKLAAEEAARQAAEAKQRAAEEAARQAEEARNRAAEEMARDRSEDYVEVWDLDGEREEDVREQVRDMGLKMGSVSRDYSDEVPAGCVMSQKPKAGRRVKKGTKMKVTISMGPKPEERTEAAETVPETVAETVAETVRETVPPTTEETVPETAEETAAQAGEEAASQAEEEMSSQAEEGGAREAEDGLVEVRDLKQASEADARKRMESMGLAMGSVTKDYSNDIPSGHVMSQKPEAGKRVKKGTKVDITVSMGPKSEEQETEAADQENPE